jgi:peptidoglycan/LPS O-acetylase OafA/YrhL
LENQALIPLFALLILGLGSCKGRLQRWLSLPIPVLLGQASYALYILHWPVYRIALAARAGLLDRSPDDHHPGTLFFLVYLAGVVAISILVFKVVELPAREYLRHLRFHRRASVIANPAASGSPDPPASSCTGAVPCPDTSAEVSYRAGTVLR